MGTFSIVTLEMCFNSLREIFHIDNHHFDKTKIFSIKVFWDKFPPMVPQH